MVADHPRSHLQTDLPNWAEPFLPTLQLVDLAGLSLEDQVQLLKLKGLPVERALRLVMSLPPLTPQGHLDRLRRAGQLLNQVPNRFWLVVESLSVYWNLHPWSILGEPLRHDFSREWSTELRGPWSRDGLWLVGHLGHRKPLPSGICARRLKVEGFPHLRRLPKGWIVGDLVLRDCPKLGGSLGDLSVLGSTTIERCPNFNCD